MAAAIEELSLNDELESHGYTAAIPGVLRKGGTGIKIISSIFRQVYKGNVEILTAWETASHVERAAKPATAPTPANS